MKFYTKLVDNDKLREKLKAALFDVVYNEYIAAKAKMKGSDQKQQK